MIDLHILATVAAALFIVNVLTYATWAHDKRSARLKVWRVPESRLLLLAALGGMPAAKLAQHRLRHKTWKEPFRSKLNEIAGLQAMTFLCLAIPSIRHAMVSAIAALTTML